MKVFRKTGVSTLINILGMSVAFAAAMILMVQVRWDTTYDANFEGHKQVFRVENNWMDKGLFSTSFSRPMIEIAKTARKSPRRPVPISRLWGLTGLCPRRLL